MGPRVAALALVLGTGCRAVFGLEPPDHDFVIDGAPESPGDVAIDACPSKTTVFSTCGMALDGDVSLTVAVTYDTDQRALVPNFGGMQIPSVEVTTATGPLVVVLFHSFTIASGGTLRVVGSKPLAIVADTTIDVSGTIDLGAAGAAHRNNCDPVAGTSGNGGGGGGGGGGFGSIGGTGGDGNSDGTARAGGNGGSAQARPLAPLGGCDGAGGGDSGGGGGGPTGKAGGAVMLAASSIAVTSGGLIDACGGGGGYGRAGDGGGGGGGSGGFILLEAQNLQIDGVVVANGGGGGEGGEALAPGEVGSRGLTSTSPAPGGAGNAPDGGDGGAGGAALLLAGRSSTQTKPGGGGGGGGGVGFVAFGAPQLVVSASSTISPGYTSWP